MKIVRLILTTLAAVVIAGTIANAAPHLSSSGGEPSPSPSVSVSPEPSPSPEPSASPEPSESPSLKESQNGSGAPDFSACVGLTGLENAICRHEALLVLQPDNPGLQNSLSHLEANLAKHQSNGQSHGQSGESHGQSGH